EIPTTTYSQAETLVFLCLEKEATMKSVKPDYAETKRFLTLLDPNAATFHFTTIEEAGGKGSVLEWRGDLQRRAPSLTTSNHFGCGVFVVVNETDGNGRRSDNIRRVRAVWQEDDDGWNGELPLPPSMIVQSSQGRCHRYWLIEDDWLADEQGR